MCYNLIFCIDWNFLIGRTSFASYILSSSTFQLFGFFGVVLGDFHKHKLKTFRVKNLVKMTYINAARTTKNILSSSTNCDTLCLRLTVIKTDWCDYGSFFQKPWHTFLSYFFSTSSEDIQCSVVLPIRDMWKLNMFIVS